jgi:hypothetical protein
MTDRERRVLERSIDVASQSESGKRSLGWAASWFAGFVLFTSVGVFTVARPRGILSVLGAFAIVLGLVFFLLCVLVLRGYFSWRRFWRRWRSEQEPGIRRALEDGRVMSRRFTATSVIELEEWEDEGPGYLFQVADGKVLFLKGQPYATAEDDTAWPNSDFELVRTLQGNRWVGIFCHGESLTPLRVIAQDQLRDDVIWSEREDVVEGSVESVAASITK